MHKCLDAQRLSAAGTIEGLDPMLSCDYNGWNDAPEEEREWFDQHPEIWAALPPGSHAGTGLPLRRPLRSRTKGGMAA